MTIPAGAQVHGWPSGGSFWAMMTTIIGLVAGALLSEAVSLLVKTVALAATTVLLGTTAAAYGGYTERFTRWWAARRWHRFIRQRPDLIRDLAALNERLREQIGNAQRTRTTLGWVWNTIQQKLVTSGDVPSTSSGLRERTVSSEANGMWTSWRYLINYSYASTDETGRLLAGAANRDSEDFLAAVALLNASLSVLSAFTFQLISVLRLLTVDWGDSALDEWDGVKAELNALFRDAGDLFLRVNQAFPDSRLPTSFERVRSIKVRGDATENQS